MLGSILVATSLAAPSPRDAVVVVQQGGGTCAGVVLDDGRVATAYHCVAGGFGARIEREDGARVRARVRATDPGHDLALLEPEALLDGGLTLGTSPEVGDAVTVIGHPYAGAPPAGFLEGTLRWSVAEGAVAAVGARSLQIDATVAPGNSGGPVLDAQDRVVGIVSRRIGDRIGFAGRAEALRELTEEAGRRGPGGTIGAAPAAWLTDRPVVGLDLEATWRERVLLGLRAGVPVAPLVRAVLEEEVEATLALGRLGGRLPVGTGPGSIVVEAFVGLGGTRVYRSPDGGLPVTSLRIDSFVGGGLGRGGTRFEVARRLGSAQGADWLLGLRLGLGALRRVW